MRRYRLLVAAGLVAGCGQAPAPETAVVAAAPAPVAESFDPAIVTGDRSADTEVTVVPDPPSKARDGGGFEFPADASGRWLEKKLVPALPVRLFGLEFIAPRPRRFPASLASPAPALPNAADAPPRLTMAPAATPKPAALPDRIPADLGGPFRLPDRPDLPTAPLTRGEGRDVSLPPDLPALSPKPVPDRASLADPTVEFTARSVVADVLPLRTVPTGFMRIGVPDPFENADAAKVRTPVVDNPNRSLPSVPPPK